MIIVFDADGVLFPSTPVKKDSWEVLLSFPGFTQEHVSLAQGELSDRALSRYEILDILFHDYGIVDEAKRKVLVNQYATLYGEAVKAGISMIEPSHEVRSTLDRLLQMGVSMYVNTATPESEITKTLDHFNLSPYFKGVFGKPHSKKENFDRVMKEEQVSPKDILYIGDEWRDVDAARVSGVQFAALNVPWTDWKGVEFQVLTKFSDILALLPS